MSITCTLLNSLSLVDALPVHCPDLHASRYDTRSKSGLEIRRYITAYRQGAVTERHYAAGRLARLIYCCVKQELN